MSKKQRTRSESVSVGQKSDNRAGGLVSTQKATTHGITEGRLALLKTATGQLNVLMINEKNQVYRSRPSKDDLGVWQTEIQPFRCSALTYLPDTANSDQNAIFSINDFSDGSSAFFERISYQAETDCLIPLIVSDPISSKPSPKSIGRFRVVHTNYLQDEYLLSAGVHRATSRKDSGGNYEQIYAFKRIGEKVGISDQPQWLWWSPESHPFSDQILKSVQLELFPGTVAGKADYVPNYLAVVAGQPMLLQGKSVVQNGRYLNRLIMPLEKQRQLPVLSDTTSNGLVTWAGAVNSAPQVFVLQDNNVILTAEGKPTEQGDYVWAKQWQTIQIKGEVGPSRRFIKIFSSQMSADGGTDVFLIDQDLQLWNLHKNTNGQWGELVDLQTLADHLVVGFEGTDPADPTATTVFASDGSKNNLTRLQRTEDGRWIPTDIDLSLGTATGIKTNHECSTTYSIKSDTGMPIPGIKVSVETSHELEAKINGRRALVSPVIPYDAITDGQGEITIRTDTIGALGAPSLTLSAPEIPDGSVSITASTGLHTLLGTITGNTLQQAKDPESTEPILPGNLNTSDYEHAAKALNISMLAGNKFMPDSQVRMTPGEICFGRSGVQTKSLNATEFEKQWQDAKQQESEAHAYLLDKGILGVDWGVIWQAVKEKVVEIGTVFAAAGRIILKIGGFLLRFVVNELAQAFDMAWIILSHFGAELGKLFNWIQQKFGTFLSWSTIVANKNQIKSFVSRNTLDLSKKIPKPSTKKKDIDKFLSKAEKTVDAWIGGTLDNDIDNMIKKLNLKNKTVASQRRGGVTWGDTKLPNGKSLLPQYAIQWVIDELTGSKPDPKLIKLPDLSALESSFEKMLTDVGNDTVALTEDVAKQTLNGLQGWIDKPATLGNTDAVDMLTGLMRPISKDGFKLADDMINNSIAFGDAAVDSVTEVLKWTEAELQLPFFTEFYEYTLNTGSVDANNQLSWLDLFSLLIAIAATPALGEFNLDGMQAEVEAETETIMAGLAIIAASLQRAIEFIADFTELLFAYEINTLREINPKGADIAELTLILFMRIPQSILGLIAGVFTLIGSSIGKAAIGIRILVSTLMLIDFSQLLLLFLRFPAKLLPKFGSLVLDIVGVIWQLISILVLVALIVVLALESRQASGEAKTDFILSAIASAFFILSTLVGVGELFLANTAAKTPPTFIKGLGYSAYAGLHLLLGSIGNVTLLAALILALTETEGDTV